MKIRWVGLVAFLSGVLMAAGGCPTTSDDDDAGSDDDTGDDDTGDDDTGDDDASDDDTGDDDAGDDDAGDDDTEPDGTLSNNPDGCKWVHFTVPWDIPEGSWDAARLTPSVYPFHVHEVTYTLSALGTPKEHTCNSTLAHTVWLFTSSDVVPPANPTLLAEIDVPSGGTLGQDRVLVLPIDPPVTIPNGEHLFVAIQMMGTWPDPMCLDVCFDQKPPPQADRNYYALETKPPFSWESVEESGWVANMMIEASGTW